MEFTESEFEKYRVVQNRLFKSDFDKLVGAVKTKTGKTRGGNMRKAGVLRHGGVMVNYQCTAACRHCLYSCSPTRGEGYLDGAAARRVAGLLRAGGCRSVHIGGGEPFLDFEGLLVCAGELAKAGVTVEYVETNAFWAGEESGAVERKLARLAGAGVDTLCISLDPFHAEYVPYGLPLALAEKCRAAGMGYFLWKEEFLPLLSRLDPARAHSREEMEARLGPDYIDAAARRYGIGYGGRAVTIEDARGVFKPTEVLLASSSPHNSGCRNLLSTEHFHVDRDGFFIPPGCTGIRLPLTEVVAGLPDGKYPAFEALYTGGLAALVRLARERGFVPRSEGYASSCGLCFFARRFLAAADGFPELDPRHYEEALAWTGPDVHP